MNPKKRKEFKQDVMLLTSKSLTTEALFLLEWKNFKKKWEGNSVFLYFEKMYGAEYVVTQHCALL